MLALDRTAPRMPVLLVIAAALVTAACGAARTKADCDQLLHDQRYQDAADVCDNPFHRASAYLGLAGFEMGSLLNSSAPPGDVVALLGLTRDNITSRRQYLELAVQSVRPPDGPTQAFALLLSAFLGFGTSSEEYLDANLDGTIAQTEIESALGATAQDLPLIGAGGPVVPYFSVVANGKPYLLDCSLDVTAPVCTHPSTRVFDDPDGSGRLTTQVSGGRQSNDKNQVLSSLGTATSVAYPLEVFVASPPYSFNAAATQTLPVFLGPGRPQGPFKLGIGGYLQAIREANAVLAASGGSPGGSTVNANVSALVTSFDNGAPCLSKTLPQKLSSVSATLLGYLDALNTIYAASAGTALQPVPAGSGASYYMSRNIVPGSIKVQIDTTFGSIWIPEIPAATYGFPGGSVSRYKIMFTTQTPPLPSLPPLPTYPFDADTAVPRADGAYAAFVPQFEAIPVFAPNVTNDGRVSFMELLCVGK